MSNLKHEVLKDYCDSEHKLINGKKWTRTLPVSELKEGEKKKFLSDKEEIILIRKNGIYAIKNICPHMNLSLIHI